MKAVRHRIKDDLITQVNGGLVRHFYTGQLYIPYAIEDLKVKFGFDQIEVDLDGIVLIIDDEIATIV